jgi:hypothetical protein
MQRWIRLPQGGFIDASKVVFIGRIESFAKLDEEGNAAGTEYSVAVGTNLGRDSHTKIHGNKEEISAFVKSLLGQAG